MSNSESKPLGAAEVGRVRVPVRERTVGGAPAAAFDPAVVTEVSAEAVTDRPTGRAVERRLERRQDAERRGFRVIESAQQRTVTVEATESVTVRVVEDDGLVERRSSGVARPRSSEAMAAAEPSDVDEEAAQRAAGARAFKRYTDAMTTADASSTVKIYASSAGGALALRDPLP
jgi:hypothetical protein